ncbi:MAG: transglutaminase-like domain-containing protein [Candidatus Dojkabacteria bacterium]|jgi:transglutaminase-like putative cysteine protease
MQEKFLKYLFLIVLLFTIPTSIYAQTYDFNIQNNTTIRYQTGQDFVLVQTTYIREVRNSKYFYSMEGEKIFHIPDLPTSKAHEIQLERQYKKDSLKVIDPTSKRNLTYTLEQLKDGEGMYLKVPNYKETTLSSPYKIFVEYKTHDLVKRNYNHTILFAPALYKDTPFVQKDEKSGTKTSLSYDLKIITEKDIQPLVRVFPKEFKLEQTLTNNIYSFSAKDRIEHSPTLEFGTEQIYRFELKYKTPKTDSIVPDKYSSLIGALSTNIYEFSLPRDFGEVNQRVKIERIYPTPVKLTKDSEGNMVARFEVAANKSSEILVTGYIWLKQDSYENRRAIPEYSLGEYFSKIKEKNELKKYTTPTKYWESTDIYIASEAKKLLDQSSTIMELIKNDYRYINSKLEYDEQKANSKNERMGARAALQGEASVCMEYADSMIAILRAQGVPARAALGYSNLVTKEKSDTEGNSRHQWVHIWIPEYGWLSVDPTVEGENMLIGQNIEKVLWETFFDEKITNIKIYSADNANNEDFSNYSVSIYAVESVPNQETLLEYSDITSVEEGDSSSAIDGINTFIKTTVIGKSIIILLPILLVLGLLILLLNVITKLAKRTKSRKVYSNQQP